MRCSCGRWKHTTKDLQRWRGEVAGLPREKMAIYNPPWARSICWFIGSGACGMKPYKETEHMITEEDITAALEIIGEASHGPARWVEPATGVDADGKRRDPCVAFAEMLNAGQWTGEQVSFEQAVYDSENCLVHGVSIQIDGGTVEDIEKGGEHRVVAITGNGKNSKANARFIAGALSPEAGWAACLLEVRRLRAKNAALLAEVAEHFPIAITARAFYADEATLFDLRAVIDHHMQLTPEQQLTALPSRLQPAKESSDG